MIASLTRAEAETVLFREAACLDSGRWQEWLALYTEDAVFHMPAWRDELIPTQDPESELSLIYYKGRTGLEDRVLRASSGQSVASHPRPRCVHAITNIMIEGIDGDEANVASNFTVHLHDVRASRSHCFFGHYLHRLRPIGRQWLISAKTIFLLNDTIPTVVDFYSI